MSPGNPSDDAMVKLSTEASTDFIGGYYHALHSRRNTISTFYISPSTMQGGKPIPTIIFNGNALQTGDSVQEMFEKQMPATRYDAQSIDCHILNAHYAPEGTLNSGSAASTMTILVAVSGAVRFGEDRNDPERQFSETFVLVPNHDRGPRGGRPKQFLIQSQNFRLVV